MFAARATLDAGWRVLYRNTRVSCAPASPISTAWVRAASRQRRL